MVIVWGSRLMGKCDVVPGVFHVQTRFGHLWYLPLIPMGSYLVVGPDHGVSVSLSVKSILLAWARTIAFIVAMAMSLYAAILIGEGKPSVPWLMPAVLAAAAWGVCLVLCFAPFLTRASYNRAMRLAAEAGFNQEGLAAIEAIYGQSGRRGFEVAQPARNSGTAPAATRRPVANANQVPWKQ